MNERDALMRKIQEYGFAAYDWNLYLDTHPCDKKAIAMYHNMAKKARECMNMYNEKYGPLYAHESRDMNFWNWVDMPWPWD
jgi:spore coat protein JB